MVSARRSGWEWGGPLGADLHFPFDDIYLRFDYVAKVNGAAIDETLVLGSILTRLRKIYAIRWDEN
jgi:hypothetical protein